MDYVISYLLTYQRYTVTKKKKPLARLSIFNCVYENYMSYSMNLLKTSTLVNLINTLMNSFVVVIYWPIREKQIVKSWCCLIITALPVPYMCQDSIHAHYLNPYSHSYIESCREHLCFWWITCFKKWTVTITSIQHKNYLECSYVSLHWLNELSMKMI